ncbi:MAG: hypothetical protein LC772_11030, partial [Chloroflexi bacterium]|nr:hypothetical protein [Chloroflexota bacterium]
AEAWSGDGRKPGNFCPASSGSRRKGSIRGRNFDGAEGAIELFNGVSNNDGGSGSGLRKRSRYGSVRRLLTPVPAEAFPDPWFRGKLRT